MPKWLKTPYNRSKKHGNKPVDVGLTPQLFSGLCRLGYRLSSEAVSLIAAEGPLEEEPWEAMLR